MAEAADDSSAVLEEILVTARKRTESAQDIPESITTVDADVIARAGLTSINDIHMIATSVNLNRRQDDSPNVVMRGVGSFGNVQGVGFYIDDVQVFTGMTERTEDIARIEILKGPQGTLYGGNNIGGAIKYVPKSPTQEWSGEARLQGGRFGRQSVSGALSGPLLEDRASFRLSAYGDHSDGYMYNTFERDTIDQKDEYGGRFALSAGLTDQLDATFSLRASRLDNDGFNVYYRATAPDAYRSTVNYDDSLGIERDIVMPIVTLNWRNDAGYGITSISSYQSASVDYSADLDFEADPNNRVGLDSHYYDQAYSQEIRVLSPTEGRAFTWIAGIYGLSRQSASATDVYIYDPDGAVLFTVPLRNRDEWEQYAAFASGSYELSEDWIVSAGARVNHSKRTTIDRVAAMQGSVDETSFLPKASLQYEPRPNTMLYFTYAHGLEPGAIATLGPGDFRPYDAEKTRNYELGVKSELLQRRLRLNAAVFFTDYSNRLFESFVISSVGSPEEYIQNIGDSRNMGAEAELEWRISSRLTVSMGASVIDAAWKDGVRFFDANSHSEIDLGRSDKKPPFVPASSATAAVDWSYPVGSGATLLARADVAYSGKSYWDVPNAYAQESYTLANASLGVELGAWSLTVQGRNLFDTEYNNEYLAMIYSGLPADLASRGEPRTWLITVAASF